MLRMKLGFGNDITPVLMCRIDIICKHSMAKDVWKLTSNGRGDGGGRRQLRVVTKNLPRTALEEGTLEYFLSSSHAICVLTTLRYKEHFYVGEQQCPYLKVR